MQLYSENQFIRPVIDLSRSIVNWRGEEAKALHRETLRGKVRLTCAGSGVLLSKGQTVSGLMDAVGDPAGSGGLQLVDYETNFEKGVVPTGMAYDLLGISARVTIAGLASVITEAKLNALVNNTVVLLKHQNQEYNIGRLCDWLSPYQTVTGRASNAVALRKFSTIFELAPGDKFKVDFKQVRDLSGGVAANDIFDIDFEFDCITYLMGQALTKQ